MIGKYFMKISLAAALFIGAAQVAAAQSVDARNLLSTFPESQALLYVNSRRVFDEALPRIVPPQELEKVFGDIQKQSGFDVRSIHFVALGVRYKEPFSMKTPPDFVVMVKGSFNADAMLSLLRVATEGSYTQEKYGERTINVFKFKKEESKEAQGGEQQTQQAKPQGSPFPISEIAAVTFDANTLIVGVPGFVRAAIDAADGGQGRVRAELIDLVARNPDNLMSVGGDLPSSLLDMMKGMGMPQNEEAARVIGSLRQLQFAVNMNATDFGAQTVVRTDTPENAQVLNGFVTMGLGFGRMALDGQIKKVPADKPGEREAMQAVLDALGSLRNAANNNELQIDVSVPQATVASLVQKEMARQKANAAKKAAAAPKAKSKTKRRATARRRR